MTAFGRIIRRRPVRTLSASAASVLTAIGGTLAAPVSAAAGPAALAEQQITWTDTPDTPLRAGSVPVAAVSSSGLPVQYTSTSSDVCTSSGDVVTLHRQGRCTIRATQPGNGSFAAAAPASDTFAVLGRAQTITWTRTPDTPVAAGTVQVAAAATSGLAVTYRSGTPRTCKIKGRTVTLVAGGACTVHADQPGDDEYAAATRADDTFTVARTAQTISFARPGDTSTAARTVQLSATASSGLAVSVTSTDKRVCTVARRRVTLVGAGTCTLRADQRGNGRYAPAQRVERAFAVGRGRQTITFPQPPPVPLSAGTVTVAPTANSGLPVTVTSADERVCTVTGTTVTLRALGTCVLRAHREGTANWAAAPGTEVRFTVGRGTQSIAFPAPPATAAGAGTVTLAATATSGLPVALRTSGSGVCDADGTTVMLLADGACVLTARQDGDRRYAAAPDVTATLTVLQDPVPVTVPTALPSAAGALSSTGGPAAAAGAAITVRGGGYTPGTAVQVAVYSTPQPLGTTFAAADGTFALLVVVPADLGRGGHTLVAAGLAADNTLRFLTAPFVVSRAARSLPVTGGAVGTVAAIGSWAVLIGTVLALLGRRGWSPRRRWMYRLAYQGRHAVAV